MWHSLRHPAQTGQIVGPIYCLMLDKNPEAILIVVTSTSGLSMDSQVSLAEQRKAKAY
jgi:hypothetical protein